MRKNSVHSAVLCACACLMSSKAAVAQYFDNVSTTVNGSASVMGTEVLTTPPLYQGGPPGPQFNVSIPFQSGTLSGTNQTLTVGSTALESTTISNSLTIGQSLTLQTGAGTGFATSVYNPVYNASGYVVPSTSDAGSITAQAVFQVPNAEIVTFSGIGNEPATSQELQSWTNYASLIGPGVNLQFYNDNWSLNGISSGFSTYAGPSVELMPYTNYTLSVTAGIETPSEFFPYTYNPNGTESQLSVQVLSVVPEPSASALLAAAAAAGCLRRRRSEGADRARAFPTLPSRNC